MAQQRSNGTPPQRNLTLLNTGQTILALLVAAWMIVSTVVTVWTLVEVEAQSTKNGITLQRLIDCTTPGGRCYERSNSATGEAVANINEVSIAAAYCAKTMPQGTSERQYRSCIEHHLPKGK